MATFVSTIKFSDQGRANIRDTCKRATAFKSAAKKMGVKVRDIYWSVGPFDGVIVMEAPDEETVTAAMLYLGSLGNVHTETARSYKASEMEEILAKMPD